MQTYTGSMESPLADKPADEGQRLPAARYAELKAAVGQGIASLESGRSRRISVFDLDEYLDERGRLATKRAAAKRA